MKYSIFNLIRHIYTKYMRKQNNMCEQKCPCTACPSTRRPPGCFWLIQIAQHKQIHCQTKKPGFPPPCFRCASSSEWHTFRLSVYARYIVGAPPQCMSWRYINESRVMIIINISAHLDRVCRRRRRVSSAPRFGALDTYLIAE